MVADKIMNGKSYTAAIENAYKAIDIHMTIQLHKGRIQGASTLDLEEVDELDKRALGNGATDIFGNCCSKKLPLREMRAIAGHDTRKGSFI